MQPSLPPVPESLRVLARQQIANGNVPKVRSARKLVRDMANELRRMRAVAMPRVKAPGTIAHVCGGWANAGEWQLLLAAFDDAIAALRAAWQELKDTEPAVQEVCHTWRATHNIPDDFILNEDKEEFWLLFWPPVEQALGNSLPLLEAACEQWQQVIARYLKLLGQTKGVIVK